MFEPQVASLFTFDDSRGYFPKLTLVKPLLSKDIVPSKFIVRKFMFCREDKSKMVVRK